MLSWTSEGWTQAGIPSITHPKTLNPKRGEGGGGPKRDGGKHSKAKQSKAKQNLNIKGWNSQAQRGFLPEVSSQQILVLTGIVSAGKLRMNLSGS